MLKIVWPWRNNQLPFHMPILLCCILTDADTPTEIYSILLFQQYDNPFATIFPPPPNMWFVYESSRMIISTSYSPNKNQQAGMFLLYSRNNPIRSFQLDRRVQGVWESDHVYSNAEPSPSLCCMWLWVTFVDIINDDVWWNELLPNPDAIKFRDQQRIKELFTTSKMYSPWPTTPEKNPSHDE